jgi:hypothetical protein
MIDSELLERTAKTSDIRYVSDMKMLACLHCATQVLEHASVCVGCGTEIVRGSTRRERSAAGCGVSMLAIVVRLPIAGMGPMPNPREEAALFLVFKFIAIGRILRLSLPSQEENARGART